jgi:NAD(P)-dependent dehydrogenase (short-subunit alcohol dehydrogenase family)
VTADPLASLAGKVALVTGGGSGIGRETALAFGRAGSRVVVADRNAATGEQTARLIADTGGEATFVASDVSKASDVESMIKRCVEVYGRLDCAHNNAGISGSGGAVRGPTADYSEESWDAVLGINLKGVWLCMKYELQQMLAQGVGAIVNTASIAGLVGIPGNIGYVASKHGVVGLTRAAALEYAPQGIRVNAVCPGYIDTPLIEALTNDPATNRAIVARHPQGRLGQPGEIADAVLWLCSGAASFVNGHMLTVDGGYVAQ